LRSLRSDRAKNATYRRMMLVVAGDVALGPIHRLHRESSNSRNRASLPGRIPGLYWKCVRPLPCDGPASTAMMRGRHRKDSLRRPRGFPRRC
jgi:hypothetical protein